jgi:hypothetical protein
LLTAQETLARQGKKPSRAAGKNARRAGSWQVALEE